MLPAPGAAARELRGPGAFAGSVFRCGCGFSPCVTGLTGLLWRFVYGSNSPRLVGLPCVAFFVLRPSRPWFAPTVYAGRLVGDFAAGWLDANTRGVRAFLRGDFRTRLCEHPGAL